MNEGRTSEQRLRDECARWRRSLREEEARHASTRTVLEDANRMLLTVYLQERLADPRDFDVYIGLDRVVDGAGRIVWARVGGLIDELLRERPHLAAPEFSDPRWWGRSALQWVAEGT